MIRCLNNSLISNRLCWKACWLDSSLTCLSLTFKPFFLSCVYVVFCWMSGWISFSDPYNKSFSLQFLLTSIFRPLKFWNRMMNWMVNSPALFEFLSHLVIHIIAYWFYSLLIEMNFSMSCFFYVLLIFIFLFRLFWFNFSLGYIRFE